MKLTTRAGAPVAPRVRGAGPLRVGVVVGMRWSPTAGGHVKTWERLARAALSAPEQIDLTVHFQGVTGSHHILGPNVRYELHPPTFSATRLPFLSHLPDDTDLARHHRRLAGRLLAKVAFSDGSMRSRYDVLHTTDGAFAFARTAARAAAARHLPLVTSVHTDLARQTRIFAAAMIERLFGHGLVSRLLLDWAGVARRAERQMRRRLDAHLGRCAFVLLSPVADRARVSALIGADRLGHIRRGIEHRVFDPARRDRAWLQACLGVPRDRCLVICVGRLDRGASVLTLVDAMTRLVARGLPVHLLCAGIGADRPLVCARLGDRVSCPGTLDPETMARAYASADICAQPSHVEEASNAVLEAQSSGLPVLVAAESGGGARRLVEDGTGFAIRGGSAAWTEALGALVTDERRRLEMGRRARAFALRAIPTWRQVLLEDLLPVWRRAAGS